MLEDFVGSTEVVVEEVEAELSGKLVLVFVVVEAAEVGEAVEAVEAEMFD